MKYASFTIIILLVASSLLSSEISVSQDGTKDFTAIQAAIEYATESDSVLVYPGRYYENVDFLGKSITVCSLEAINNDRSFVNVTIIDGGQNGATVAIRTQEQNATLRGFTITNGSGYPLYADQGLRGGGILIDDAGQVNLINCDVTKNTAVSGAGIYSTLHSLFISGVNIFDNYASVQGGGLVFNGSLNHYPTIIFDPVNLCSIYSNFGANPVDVLITDVRANLEINLDMFSVQTPDRFYVARHSNLPQFHQYTDIVNIQRAFRMEINHDLYVSPGGNDSNSGLSPAQALKSISLAVHRIAGDSLNIKTVHVLPGVYREGVNGQLLPIPLKSNLRIIGAGSGQTELVITGEKFRNPASVFVGDRCVNLQLSGFSIKSEQSGENWPIGLGNLCRNVRLSDLKIDNMKIYDEGALFGMDWESVEIDSLMMDNLEVEDTCLFTTEIRSGSIKNSSFTNIASCYSSPDSPGDDSWWLSVIDLWVSGNFALQNTKFRNISVQNNQSTFVLASSNHHPDLIFNVRVNNCLFDNIRTNGRTAMFFGNEFGSFQISNCTFYNNYGMVGVIGIGGEVSMRNNILFNPDAPKEIFLADIPPGCDYNTSLEFDYNSIPTGISGVYNYNNASTLIWGEHNVYSDPGFDSLEEQDPDYLSLVPSSSCVNAGTPDPDDLDLPFNDLANNWRIWDGRIDMGCFESGSESCVSGLDPGITPPPISGISAYPNPFRTLVHLKVDLAQTELSGLGSPDDLFIRIFNIRGQCVQSIPLETQRSGQLSGVWDGRDQNGKSCSSGLYIINLIRRGKSIGSSKLTLVH